MTPEQGRGDPGTRALLSNEIGQANQSGLHSSCEWRCANHMRLQESLDPSPFALENVALGSSALGEEQA